MPTKPVRAPAPPQPPKPTAKARRLERELHEAVTEARLIRARAGLRRLKESAALDYDWVSPWSALLQQRAEDPAWMPIGSTSARKHGTNFPFYQTEQQLGMLRDLSRIVVGTNNNAAGLLRGYNAFVIGTGFATKVSAKKGAGANGTAAAARVTTFLDTWAKLNNWPERQQELGRRTERDGDGILRLFADDGWLKCRFVWPEQVTQPPGTSFEEYSFGIKWEHDEDGEPDVEAVEEVYVASATDPARGDFVPAEDVVLFQPENDAGVKRRLPLFAFGTREVLDTAGRLTRNLGEGAAVRAAIAYMREHEAATEEDVEAANFADADFRERPLAGDTYRPVNVSYPGMVVDFAKGTNHVPQPVASDTGANSAVVDLLVRSACARINAPEWLGSSNAANMGAYTSSLVAESPFVKGVVSVQGYYRARFLRVIDRALRVAAAHGIIDRRDLELVDVDLVPPSPVVRDKLQEAQAASIEIPLGVDSRQRYCESQDRDYERVEQENKQYADTFGGQGGQLPTDTPPGDGGDGGGAGAGTDALALPESLLEMLEEIDGVAVRDLVEAGADKPPPGKVWKEITYNRGGTVVKQKRLVNAPTAPAAKPKGAAKPDPKQTVAAVKAQLAGDPSKLTPAKVKDLAARLDTLTVADLKALKAEHDLKGGKTKADHVAKLVERAKELKKQADAAKKSAKKTAPAPEQPKPAPAPEPAPKPAAPAEPHAVQGLLVNALNNSPGLSDEQREQFGAALSRVVKAMPQQALDRIKAHLAGIQFHASTADIGPALVETVAGRPGLSDEKRAELRAAVAAQIKGMDLGGVYSQNDRHIHVDGDQHGDFGPGAHTPGRDKMSAHGVYAHELAHAIDGPGHQISTTPEWQDAYREEIEYTAADRAAKKIPPLSFYGGSKPSEGFAEFARAVYASDVPHAQLVAEFPKATALFKARGLWPATERGGAADGGAKMAEVFDRRVDLPGGAGHADVLKKAESPPAESPKAEPKPKARPHAEVVAELKSIEADATNTAVSASEFKQRARDAVAGMSLAGLNRVWADLGKPGKLKGAGAAEQLVQAVIANRTALDRAKV